MIAINHSCLHRDDQGSSHVGNPEPYTESIERTELHSCIFNDTIGPVAKGDLSVCLLCPVTLGQFLKNRRHRAQPCWSPLASRQKPTSACVTISFFFFLPLLCHQDLVLSPKRSEQGCHGQRPSWPGVDSSLAWHR